MEEEKGGQVKEEEKKALSLTFAFNASRLPHHSLAPPRGRRGRRQRDPADPPQPGGAGRRGPGGPAGVGQGEKKRNREHDALSTGARRRAPFSHASAPSAPLSHSPTHPKPLSIPHSSPRTSS